jgi:hypothetical protein
MASPVTERLGFADLVGRLSGQAPRRDRERLLFSDLRPELRASKIGAIRLPRADGSRLALTLDRHWRNLKVLASHNPSIYKHQVLGAYELHGTPPPLGVYF